MSSRPVGAVAIHLLLVLSAVAWATSSETLSHSDCPLTADHPCPAASVRIYAAGAARSGDDSGIAVVRMGPPRPREAVTQLPTSSNDLLAVRDADSGADTTYSADMHIRPAPHGLGMRGASFAWTSNAAPASAALDRRGASRVVDFESDERWLRPAGSRHSAETGFALVPSKLQRDVLSDSTYIEPSRLEPVRRNESASMPAAPSVAWSLLFGLLILILRRVPLRVRPSGMWLSGKHFDS